METFKEEFEVALKNNLKQEAHRLFDQEINTKENLVSFYEEIIPSIFNSINCDENDAACIWLEHQMSAIIRSVVEASYLKVLKYRASLSPTKHVLIACLKDETHDLGAVIGSHLFELYGFKTTYVGANTPLFTLENAIEQLKPDYLVLSVTNMYNLFEMNKVITVLKKHHPHLLSFGAGRGARLHQEKLRLDGVIETTKNIESLIDSEGLICSH